MLKSTLDGIKSNLGDLGELGIECKDILIYVFVSKIKQKELVSEEDIKNNLSGENRNKYLLTHLKLKDDERDFKIEVISKKNYMSEIESLKCFYCQIVKGLKTDKNILITSILTAGVTPKTNALSDLIKASLNNNNDPRNRKKNYDCVVVPALEIDEKMNELRDKINIIKGVLNQLKLNSNSARKNLDLFFEDVKVIFKNMQIKRKQNISELNQNSQNYSLLISNNDSIC